MTSAGGGVLVFCRAVGTKLIPVILLCLVSIPVQSYQVAPGVEIDCNDNAEHIDSSPDHPTRATHFSCIVENTSSVTEEIELQYSAGELAVIGPYSITLGPRDSFTITVQARAPVHMEAGQYESSVTATVSKVSGVPTGALAQSDSDDISLTVDPYIDCNIYNTPEDVKIGADGMMKFDVMLDCSSNLEIVTNIRFVMIGSNINSNLVGDPNPILWPDGFEDMSPSCDLVVEIGFSMHNCTFAANSKSTSLSPLVVCLAMQVEDDRDPPFCSSKTINIQKSLLGFGSNGSLVILAPFILASLFLLASILFWRRRFAESK